MEPVEPTPQTTTKSKYLPLIIGAFAVVILGVATAWLLSTKVINKSSNVTNSVAAPGAKVSANEVGMLDPNIKYDTAKGTLKTGGLNNQGTHRLEREGGVSQTVYLTSSTVDLGKFVDKEVEIWGETLASKKVGWLMDVAKIKTVK